MLVLKGLIRLTCFCNLGSFVYPAQLPRSPFISISMHNLKENFRVILVLLLKSEVMSSIETQKYWSSFVTKDFVIALKLFAVVCCYG